MKIWESRNRSESVDRSSAVDRNEYLMDSEGRVFNRSMFHELNVAQVSGALLVRGLKLILNASGEYLSEP